MALADLLACAPNEIAFGANATSNMFVVSRALSRSWNPGDEIVVSEMDHHSHIDTWVLAARDRGVTVRHLPVNPKTLMLDLSELNTLINANTKLVAVGYASNAIGTINDVVSISRRCHEVGALLSVDAVHIAPHKAIDMGALGADMLFCSAHKSSADTLASRRSARMCSTSLTPIGYIQPPPRLPASSKPEHKTMKP